MLASDTRQAPLNHFFDCIVMVGVRSEYFPRELIGNEVLFLPCSTLEVDINELIGSFVDGGFLICLHLFLSRLPLLPLAKLLSITLHIFPLLGRNEMLS